MPPAVFTANQKAEVVRAFLAGASVPELMARFGTTKYTINRTLRKAGVDRNRMTAEMESVVLGRYEAGEPLRKIAKSIGTSFGVLQRWFAAREVAMRPAHRLRYVLVGPPRPMGVGGPPCPVTDEQKGEILRRYLAGESRNSLAVEFNASRPFITGLIRNSGEHIRGIKEACAGQSLPARHDAFADLENDPGAAYVAGLLMTDGCIAMNGNTPMVILTLSWKDVAHVEAVRAWLGSEHAISKVPGQVRVIKKGPRAGHRVRGGPMARYVVTSERMAADLARCGVVPAKTYTAEVELLENNPDFWRGAIDGDGSVGFRTRGNHVDAVLQFTGSERMVDQFRTFARGISGTKAGMWRGKGDYWQTTVAARKASEVIRIMYGHGGLALPRKAARAAEAIRLADSRIMK